ncbi:MAG: hypothetical protein Q8N63_06760 [Nanoarchaeota archaeon]|nr:hypothetical protein [Nanoarchaeota archaeon]
MNQKLEKALSIGIPIGGAVLGVTLLELTGFPKHLQNYQFAKVELVKEYFGGPMAYLQNIVPYIFRGAVDFGAAVLPASFSMDAYQKFKDWDELRKSRKSKK